MTHDPFAPEPDPADEPAVPNHTPQQPSEKRAVPEETDFHPYTLTFKEGTGYDAAWFVGKYRTLDDAESDLSGPGAAQLARVLARVTEISKYFHKESGGSSSSGRSGGPSSGNGKPEGADVPPAWAGPPTYCDPETGHGQKVWKKRMKKDNSGYWHGWSCSAGDRGCKTDFRNPK